MPLGKIEPLKRTPDEQLVWDQVSTLVYPDDKRLLKRLPRYDFRIWLAAVDPKTALLLDNYDSDFYEMLRYQNRKRWYHEVIDSVWRALYGRKAAH